jgi:hypothetical protein
MHTRAYRQSFGYGPRVREFCRNIFAFDTYENVWNSEGYNRKHPANLVAERCLAQ